MKQTLNDISITFDDKSAAAINGLTERQAAQLSAILQASGVWYRWNGQLVQQPPSIWARLGALWRRINAWMMGGCAIVALMLGAREAFAQELKPRAIEPIRVSLTLEESEAPGDFNKQLHVELRKFRRAVFVSKSGAANLGIYIKAGPIIAGDRAIGYASAVAVISGCGKDEPIAVLLIQGATSGAVARRTAQEINEHFFEKISR